TPFRANALYAAAAPIMAPPDNTILRQRLSLSSIAAATNAVDASGFCLGQHSFSRRLSSHRPSFRQPSSSSSCLSSRKSFSRKISLPKISLPKIFSQKLSCRKIFSPELSSLQASLRPTSLQQEPFSLRLSCR